MSRGPALKSPWLWRGTRGHDRRDAAALPWEVCDGDSRKSVKVKRELVSTTPFARSFDVHLLPKLNTDRGPGQPKYSDRYNPGLLRHDASRSRGRRDAFPFAWPRMQTGERYTREDGPISLPGRLLTFEQRLANFSAHFKSISLISRKGWMSPLLDVCDLSDDNCKTRWKVDRFQLAQVTWTSSNYVKRVSWLCYRFAIMRLEKLNYDLTCWRCYNNKYNNDNRALHI